ncbi:nidogen-like isoform X2 [Bombus pascuorum]|uniref:nidogen-like isoform X2 n=1 Tax=Bombus pascuorum TaxID=65598 RepID=UPI00298E67B2|nr:nidogen-like isoform X2 [Bombus pascuorum]
MSGQRRLRGGKRELIVVVAVSIDSSVKAVRERMTRRARPLNVSRLAVVLALVGAILAPFAAALNKNDLYPYTTPGSSILQSDVNGLLLSAETILKTPIAFYDKIFNSIFVNGNGVLSFARAMQRFFNIAFPLDDPVIAPLYTHVDTSSSGRVYYGETDAPTVLARAGGMVRSAFTDAADFVPTHVFLATWLAVGYYNGKSDKVNTYQVAISSNGTHSYVELLYPENGVQWIQGESHPNGLPDAKAQAGLMSEGRMYTLKGSGTDQIQNVDKWSNVNRPGQWLFQVGPISDDSDVKVPDNIEDSSASNQVPNCRIGATTCHSRATCVDYEVGFCCHCKQGFFGNGKSCLPNDIPLRVNGRVSGTINDVEFPARDLQCYVQPKDGRTYTALSRVPEEIGASFQLLGNLGNVIGWLFAKPIGETKNGYELTGGMFNHTTVLTYPSTDDKLTIRSNYLGLDVFGQLKVEAMIEGTLPQLARDTKVDYGDYDELYTRAQAGVIRAQSERTCKLNEGGEEQELAFIQDETIVYNECPYLNVEPEDDTTRLKFYRGVTTYEATEGIIRFAVNTKVAPLEEEDPCIQGRETCSDHSFCVVDGDSFKCVCNPGYQYLYEEDGSAVCVDVNECTAGNHMCSPDAQCINQEGSHTCQCRPGFSGDGRICESLPSCEETRCGNYEQCVMIEGAPNCICLPGFEDTEQGCYPTTQRASCDVEDNCSSNGICNFDTERQKHVCICLPGFVGDGYTCYPEAETTAVDEPPKPQCVEEMCWCPRGWEYRNNECMPQEGSGRPADVSPDRDLSAYPVPECYEDHCVCPWSHSYDHSKKICVPRPGFNHETLGPSGFHLSCNVVNRCHPYAQCIYMATTGDYECRCNPGYEGDGMECVKTDECSSTTDCLENERCSYNPANSRYECTCNPGFSMVDGRCVVSDCSTNPSQCHVNAQCVSTGEGGYKCVCIEGYNGDGVRQCVENHIGCNVLNNCGRNAVCGYNQTSANFACVCQPGYYGDGFTCLPQSSCRHEPTICSPDATCVAAGENQFACVCNEGFTGDGTNCEQRPKHEANFLLVNQGMATLRIPFAPTHENLGSPIYIAYTQMAIAIDIDCMNGKAYSSDITGNRIIELTYNGSMAETFLPKVSSPEGLAVDWISRNIFWTDSGKTTVEVANLETKKRKVLVSDGLVNPRGIAVHPYRGKIFWSDWNRASPKLEWANEDGTGRAIFLQGDYVKLPNSLSIDWAMDELCWADAGTFTISCMEIDSRNINVIANELTYPFGLAISQQNYYWTDWKTHKIEVAMKSTGDRKPPISVPPGGSGKLYGIVVVPESCPRVTNACQFENGRCNKDQLCLPNGQSGRTCACADDATGPCTDTQ